MKAQVITFCFVVLMAHQLYGKIFNGYEKDIAKVRLSITHLKQLLAAHPEFTARDKRKLNATLDELTDILVYHQVTDTLLQKFQDIAPELYAVIDTIRDHEGRSIDVFVRFTPKATEKSESYGWVSLSLSEDGICVSEFGPNSAAVTIGIISKSLVVLSHELGHLQYMIPNLPNYVKYYKKTYSKSGGSLGHECSDAGGRNAVRFERQFRNLYHWSVRRGLTRRIMPFPYVGLARERIKHSLAPRTWEVADVVPGPVKY